jgi:hypothetical protein
MIAICVLESESRGIPLVFHHLRLCGRDNTTGILKKFMFAIESRGSS